MQDSTQNPTQTQVELLMTDWLANLREKGTFVHKNTNGAIKHDRTDNYSDYFTNGMRINDIHDVLRNAREIAQGMVDSMTALPIKVVIGNDGSCFNGEVIIVASDYFDDPNLTVGDKIDLLSGFSIHEAAHANHTSMPDLISFIDSLDPHYREVGKTIQNILEDERIEYLTGEDRPGLMDFIATVKEHCWKKYIGTNVNQNITEPLPRFINTLLSAVRYPAMLTPEMVTENFDELNQIRKILTPYPLSPEGVRQATIQILDVMKDIIRKEMEKQQQQEQQQGQKQPSSDPSQQNQGGGDGQSDKNGNSTGSRKPSKTEVKKEFEKALGSGQMNDILKAIENTTPSEKYNNQNCTSAISSYDDGTKMYVNGEAEKIEGNGAGRSGLQYVVHPKADQDIYLTSLRKIKPLIPAIKKALTCQTETLRYVLRGETSGKLNTNKLASLRVGNRHVFTKKGEVSCDSVSLCLLIDESGSMGGRKLEAARETAILITEAVSQIESIKLFIYGFGGEQVSVYQENGRKKKWTLGSLRNCGGTPTGEAMKIAYQRMQRHSSPTSLMLVITDGDADRFQDVRQMDEFLRNKGILPVGVGIAGCHSVRNTFKEHVVFDQIDELAPRLSQITKKHLMKMLKRKDSLK